MPCLPALLPQDPYQRRVRISEIELMEWYGKRAHVRQSGLSWGMVEEAIVDLLKDKPYMNASAISSLFLSHSCPHPGPTSSPFTPTIPIWKTLAASPPRHWIL